MDGWLPKGGEMRTLLGFLRTYEHKGVFHKRRLAMPPPMRDWSLLKTLDEKNAQPPLPQLPR